VATHRVYLKDGPCAGTVKTITQAEWDAASTQCKGETYTFDGATHLVNGVRLAEFVFEPGHAPPPGGGSTAPHAHHGWADLRHSINHNMPGALSRSQRNTKAALTELGRARKVRL
jgi:hypothetical protein